MKIVKIFLGLFIACLAVSFNLNAQGIYFGLGGGYGFAAGKQDFPSGADQTVTIVNNNGANPPVNTTSTAYKTRNYSLGKGIDFSLYGGYMFSQHIGAELGIAYVIGGSNVGTYKSSKTDITYNPFNSTTSSMVSTDNTTTKVKGSMLRFIPAVRFTAGDGKLCPYAVAGIIIGIAGKSTLETRDTSNSTYNPSNTIDKLLTYSGGTSLGVHAALGATYNLNSKIGFFAEVNANLQTWSPGKSEWTTFTINGRDRTGSLTTYDKETIYSSSYTASTTSAGTSNTGVPKSSPSIRLPFSSIGFNIGVHIALEQK